MSPLDRGGRTGPNIVHLIEGAHNRYRNRTVDLLFKSVAAQAGGVRLLEPDFLTSSEPQRQGPSWRALWSQLLSCDHTIGVGSAVLHDRNILADNEPLVSKVISRGVFLIALYIVVNFPLAAGLADHMPDVVLFARTIMYDTAQVAVGLPQFGVDMTGVIERNDEVVAMLLASLRVAGLARQTQSDFRKAFGKPLTGAQV